MHDDDPAIAPPRGDADMAEAVVGKTARGASPKRVVDADKDDVADFEGRRQSRTASVWARGVLVLSAAHAARITAFRQVRRSGCISSPRP